MRTLSLALILGLSLAAPLSAQSRDEPLGDILNSIEEATQPSPPSVPIPVPSAPVPPSGIGTTPLPPSRIDTPFGPPTPEPEGETESLSDVLVADEAETAGPPELTEAERQAQWEAAERARLDALDRARAVRQAANDRAWEAAQADYQRQLAEREAAVAEAEAAYRAGLERTRLEAERNHALWLERVRACREGDRSACAQPYDY